MKLSELNLRDYGEFLEDPPAAFRIKTLNLPVAWDYIYQNKKILLRVDQFGLDYAQAFPPSDVMLFRRDRYERDSTWLTWITSPQFSDGAFTNFFHPLAGNNRPDRQPHRVEITFAPSHATYLIENEGVRVVTKILIPADEPAIVQMIEVTNLRDQPITLKVLPVLRHAMQWANMDAWDKPEWYLQTAFCNDQAERLGFSTYLTDPKCRAENRRGAVLWSTISGATSAEVSYEKFAGQGTWQNPSALFADRLELGLTDGGAWGEYNDKNYIFAYPPVAALQYDFELAPEETRSVQQVFAWTPLADDHRLPPVAVARESARFLQAENISAEINHLRGAFDVMMNRRRIKSPDAALDQYANEWLPLQLDWVCSLDRGHPSGMRGGRDSANDFAAMAHLEPPWTREIILTELSCQRVDGWVPRHYSAKGHAGKERDVRQHVDAGAWVIEMLYEYLAYSKDFALLDELIPWLDQPATQVDSVLQHALKAVEFFIAPENIGEHGLIKLHEGEWLDTVNQAGLEGRGEGVMITNQVIMCLTWMEEILAELVRRGMFAPDDYRQISERYRHHALCLRDALRQHAYNAEGYFNGFFNDDGHWLFSPQDPDGQRRVYAGANWWSIISGVAVPDLVDSCLKELDFLKTDMGYHLNYPPFDREPVAKVGRMASGDSPVGRSEHANPYNQGSHGFLGRALATAGRGDLLYQTLKYLLPYDQTAHPIAQTLSAPYGVVNVWENIPRYRNRGKNTFLTGSIAYAIRMVYDWMYGIRPTMDALTIDPCLPVAFKQVEVRFRYLDKNCTLTIDHESGNQAGVQSLTFNGTPIQSTRRDPFNQRQVFIIPDEAFTADDNHIHVAL